MAQKFIKDLIAPLQAKWKLEREMLFANLHPSITLVDGAIKNCDLAFAMTDYKKKKLNVSETKPLPRSRQPKIKPYANLRSDPLIRRSIWPAVLWARS